MKRILTALLTLATLLLTAPCAIAQNKGKKHNYKKNSRKVEIVRKHETPTSKNIYRMMSETDIAPSAHSFVINGHVALDIPDSCYNIYITDIDREITGQDMVACIPVKNKQFRFETDINTIKAGRIRAIMPGDKICSAWIDLFFIPGFTLDITVHNGYYDIANESEYNFMVNGWLNRDALAVLFESMGAPLRKNNDSDTSSLRNALIPYQDLLSDLKNQLDLLNAQPVPYYDEKEAIIKRMDKINAKMEVIIDQYTKSLGY